MNAQCELGLKYKREKQVDPSPLLNFLTDRDWTLSSDIPNYDKRQLRAMASAANGRIISGNNGYKLTRNATPEEIDRFRKRMRSEIQEMTYRVLATEREYHSYCIQTS